MPKQQALLIEGSFLVYPSIQNARKKENEIVSLQKCVVYQFLKTFAHMISYAFFVVFVCFCCLVANSDDKDQNMFAISDLAI